MVKTHINDQSLGTLLGAGNVAEVFAYGALVVKLYKANTRKRSAFREAAHLTMVESLGLPAPTVHGVRQIGGRWGVLMSRADGSSYADQMIRGDEAVGVWLDRMASLHWRVHSHAGGQFASLKTRLAMNIAAAPVLHERRRGALLDELAILPDEDRLCHGDFHPYNIIGSPGHEVIIDWLDACLGCPAADVCRSYVLMRPHFPDLAAAYLDAYERVSGMRTDLILKWLPCVAAARLAEGVPEYGELMKMVGD
jgi:aminoglycoside phosphotransferase (APT) family kinase protein